MLNVNLHRRLMLRILKDIYSRPDLAPHLGFKGGTAVYLLYHLPRFSVDLDFDLLEPKNESLVFNLVTRLLTPHGRLEESNNKHYTLFYLLSYQSGLQKLKLEISKRPFGSQYETKTHLGIPLLVMSQADMFAHKLVALTERPQVANRDLFDIHFFLQQNWSINTDLVEKRTGLSYSGYIQKCLDLIEKVPPDSLLTNIGELIDAKTKYWIKTHLKPDLVSLLQIHLDSFPSS